MERFGGYDEAKKAAQYTPGEQIPKGAYVCKIIKVRYTPAEADKSATIEVLFDVVEGEYKDFFKKQYDAIPGEDKKWKGRAFIWCPKDDGSEKDGWTKNAFARWTNSLEASNKGYVWDWDESKWIGKVIGLNYRITTKMIEGKVVSYPEVAFPVSIWDVREGKVKPAKDKDMTYGAGASAPASEYSEGFSNVPAGGLEDIPF